MVTKKGASILGAKLVSSNQKILRTPLGKSSPKWHSVSSGTLNITYLLLSDKECNVKLAVFPDSFCELTLGSEGSLWADNSHCSVQSYTASSTAGSREKVPECNHVPIPPLSLLFLCVPSLSHNLLGSLGQQWLWATPVKSGQQTVSGAFWVENYTPVIAHLHALQCVPYWGCDIPE